MSDMFPVAWPWIGSGIAWIASGATLTFYTAIAAIGFTWVTALAVNCTSTALLHVIVAAIIPTTMWLQQVCCNLIDATHTMIARGFFRRNAVSPRRSTYGRLAEVFETAS